MEDNYKDLHTVAFYNLENLFDTIDDPDTNDDDFTPEGSLRWTEKRYRKKIDKLARVISQIGEKETKTLPTIVGIAEVENLTVVKDLIKQDELRDIYECVHYDSSDERGMDVALLYNKNHFIVLESENVPLLIFEEDGQRDYTRDMLFVKGTLDGELIYLIVNHWPSRRRGTEETEYKRVEAAKRVHEIVQTINEADAKIIIMGDFNDNPNSKSIKSYLVTEQFYNPFESLYDKGRGTSVHAKDWYLFDQIILSTNFFELDTGLRADKKAQIFSEYFLKSWEGKRKGNPFRTYLGKWHQGGYSDHFPVYVTLRK